MLYIVMRSRETGGAKSQQDLSNLLVKIVPRQYKHIQQFAGYTPSRHDRAGSVVWNRARRHQAAWVLPSYQCFAQWVAGQCRITWDHATPTLKQNYYSSACLAPAGKQANRFGHRGNQGIKLLSSWCLFVIGDGQIASRLWAVPCVPAPAFCPRHMQHSDAFPFLSLLAFLAMFSSIIKYFAAFLNEKVAWLGLSCGSGLSSACFAFMNSSGRRKYLRITAVTALLRLFLRGWAAWFFCWGAAFVFGHQFLPMLSKAGSWCSLWVLAPTDRQSNAAENSSWWKSG